MSRTGRTSVPWLVASKAFRVPLPEFQTRSEPVKEIKQMGLAHPIDRGWECALLFTDT
jgi:hypothetical protein